MRLWFLRNHAPGCVPKLTILSVSGDVMACRGKQVAVDVAAGLHWLHSHRIVHFDVKSQVQTLANLPATLVLYL